MRRQTINFILVSLAILLWLQAPVLAAEQVRIQCRSSAIVKGEEIRLGDIADIRAPEFLKPELARISLGTAPKPERTLLLNENRIRSTLLASRLVDPGAAVEIPDRVYVKRAGQTLEKKTVQKVFERFLAEYFNGREYKLKSFRFRGAKPYPQGEMEIIPDRESHPGNDGNLSLQADVLIDGKKYDRIHLQGRVAAYENFPCAGRPLKRGDKITSQDVYMAQKDTFRMRGDYARTLEELENTTLLSNLKKGDSFRLSMLKASPLVRKGDVVKLMAKKQNLVIETLGICKEDGYADKPVWVENMASGKPVRGMVTSDAVVEVLF